MITNDYSPSMIREIAETARKARIDYELMREKVMRKIYDHLEKSGKAYTARELSEQFGLPIRVIARLARSYGFRVADRWVEQRFAPLNEYNEPDFNNIMVTHRRVKEYSVNNDRARHYW